MDRPRGYSCELEIVKNGKRNQRGIEAVSIVFSPRSRWPLKRDRNRVLEFDLTQANLELAIEYGVLMPGTGDDFAPMSRQTETETTEESGSSSAVKATVKGGLESGESAKTSTKHKRVNFTVTPRPELKQNPSWNFYNQGAALEGELFGRLTDIKVSDFDKLSVTWKMNITIHDIEVTKVPVTESNNPIMRKLVRHSLKKKALEVHQNIAKQLVSRSLNNIPAAEVNLQ